MITAPREGPGPWHLLTRAVSAAFSPAKLFLATCAVTLLWVSLNGLDRLFPRSPALAPKAIAELPRVDPTTLQDPVGLAREAVVALSQPARSLLAPFAAVFQFDGGETLVHHGLAALSQLALWSVVGTVIARLTLLQVTSPVREAVGLGHAVKFVGRRTASLAASPLLPLVGVGSIMAMIAILGLLYRLPGGTGAFLAGAFGLLPYLGGLGCALLLAALAFAWPLMVAGVAAHGEDAYDAFSRAFSYATQRPWKYLGYLTFAALLGIPAVLVVSVLADASRHLAIWGLAISAPDDLLMPLVQTPPDAPAASTAAALHVFWHMGVRIFASSFVYVYFWTAFSIIYLLLRRDVDGYEWDDIERPEVPGRIRPHVSNGKISKGDGAGPSNGVTAPEEAVPVTS